MLRCAQRELEQKPLWHSASAAQLFPSSRVPPPPPPVTSQMPAEQLVEAHCEPVRQALPSTTSVSAQTVDGLLVEVTEQTFPASQSESWAQASPTPTALRRGDKKEERERERQRLRQEDATRRQRDKASERRAQLTDERDCAAWRECRKIEQEEQVDETSF